MSFERNQEKIFELQRRFLSEIEAPFQRTARLVVSRSFTEARNRIGNLRDAFSTIKERNPGEITDPDERRRAIALFDEAYDTGNESWKADRFWRALYQDDEGRRILKKWRRRGVVKFSSKRLKKGRAPQLITINTRGHSEFRSMHIDHVVPRKRNPFRVFDATNLQLVSEKYNTGLKERSQTSSPAAPERQADEIERYAVRNRLARDQRSPDEKHPSRSSLRKRRRRARRASRTAQGIGIIALLSDLLWARSRADTYAELAQEARELQRERKQKRNRVVIDRGEVEADNMEEKIRAVYDDPDPLRHRKPPLVDSLSQQKLLEAVQHWLDTNYGRGGSGTQQFLVTFSIVSGESPSIGGEMSERNEQLGLLMDRHRDEQEYLDDALDYVQHLLTPRNRYLRQAEALEKLADVSATKLEQELDSYGVSIEDASTLVQTRRALAASYRNYVAKLEQLKELLETAVDRNRERQANIERAIEHPEEFQ